MDSRMIFGSLMLLALSGLPVFGDNIVNNGSFETGDFTGWTTGGNFGFTSVTTGPFYAFSGAQDGNFYAMGGAVGSDATISQTLLDTVGATYTFSFWLNGIGDAPSDFNAAWNGTTLLSLSDPNTGGVWTQFSYSVMGTGSDTITFGLRNDPEFVALDNVSVDTPEPTSLAMLGGGLVALRLRLRRRAAHVN
jgi:hypothetical protein